MTTTTINTTTEQDVRIVTAFGTYLNLGREATTVEVKEQIIGFLKQIVHDQEYIAAVKVT